MSEAALFINGQWQQGNGISFSSINPSSNKSIWHKAAASDQQVIEAIDAAKVAFSSWSGLELRQRIQYLQLFAEQLQTNRQELAYCIAEETGKPLWESDTEVGAMIGKIALSVKAYEERSADKLQANLELRHRPHGIMAVLGPYNFPGHLPNGHIVPALLAGNTVVFKPSELTPKVAELTLQCWQQSKLPAGVLNLVQGKVEVGKALLADPRISGVLFTGSSTTGQAIHKQFGGQPEKLLALEMGGNNAQIVADTKDIEAAALLVAQSAYLSAGQRCTCTRRLILVNKADNKGFVEALIKRSQQIVVGHFLQQPEPFMGPVISSDAAKKLLDAQQSLVKAGGNSLLEMKSIDLGPAYLSPGIIDVTNIQALPDEEYFGPLLQLIRVENMDEAIATANNTRFGLSLGLISDNEEHYKQVIKQGRAGIINWNTPLPGASGSMPFGGIGASGNHNPSAYYAADYCVYPVATQTQRVLQMASIKPIKGLFFAENNFVEKKTGEENK